MLLTSRPGGDMWSSGRGRKIAKKHRSVFPKAHVEEWLEEEKRTALEDCQGGGREAE